MAEETPAEREERLQRQEERLAKQHERLKEGNPPRGGGGGGFGKGLAGIGTFLGEHKLIMFGLIGFAIVAYVFYAASKNKASGANTANQSAATGGNMCIDSSGNAAPCASMNPFALDQLTQQLNQLQSQFTTLQNSINNPPPKPPPPPPPTPSKLQLTGTVKGAAGRIWGILAPGQKAPSGVAVNEKGFVLVSGNEGKWKGEDLTSMKIPFEVVNPMANHSPTFSNMALADRAVAMSDVSQPGISGGSMMRSDVGQRAHQIGTGGAPTTSGSGYNAFPDVVLARSGFALPPGLRLPIEGSHITQFNRSPYPIYQAPHTGIHAPEGGQGAKGG